MPYRAVAASLVFALAMLAVDGAPAAGAPLSACDAAKKTCLGKYVAAVFGCHAKAERKGDAVAAECLAKAADKLDACYAKRDGKTGNDCAQTGNAGQQRADADALVVDVVTAVDPSYPAANVTTCGAARKTCVAKKAAGLMKCAAKANKTGSDDPACAPEVAAKFGAADGCDAKALAKGPDCLGAATSDDLETRIDDWAALAVFTLDYSGPTCGNGVLDPGEFCDPGSPNRPDAACGSAFACVGCTCACPTSLHVAVDAASPATHLDLGWTGLGLGSPVGTDLEWTLAVSGCAGSERPCGVCSVTGPIPNAGAGEVRNRRCSNDASVACTDDTPCGGGTCEYFLGGPQPLATGGITVCTVHQLRGPIAGTLNVENGALATTMRATARVYNGIAIDTPCPQCVGDPTANDGTMGGTCAGGARDGLACDANGTVPGRPDFGATSLDCSPAPAFLVATLPIDLSNTTDPVAKAITTSSPTCTGTPGAKCLCDTCNDAAAEPCMSSADCPVGGICGGRRCLGGVNAGAPCVGNTGCPGGGICARPGEPTRRNACLDDLCVDGDPVDGAGECVHGPLDGRCTAPHVQRYCSLDADCTPGTCVTSNRLCLATPSDAVTADGSPGPFARDVASPTLASIFCVAPTGMASTNSVLGLPGPARALLQVTATGRP